MFAPMVKTWPLLLKGLHSSGAEMTLYMWTMKQQLQNLLRVILLTEHVLCVDNPGSLYDAMCNDVTLLSPAV